MSSPTVIQPIIYDLFEPSTCVWQYVVADPSTGRCLVIDPILETRHGTGASNTAPADAILDLVKAFSYKVDRLLATHASNGRQTAIWYLRMQLLESQGYAPQVSGGELVLRIFSHWERRLGSRSGVTTTIGQNLRDGVNLLVGSMQVHAIHLPGLAPNDFAFIVGSNVFGALSIYRWAYAFKGYPDLDSYVLTNSLQKIESLPRHFRLLPDQGQAYDPVRTPCITISECT